MGWTHVDAARVGVEQAPAGSPTFVGRDGPASVGGGHSPNRIATLRVALRVARADLARIQSHAEEMEWQRNVARAEAERWKLEYRWAMKSCDTATARREALAAAIPGAVSAILMNARATAWEEGWDAGQDGGLIREQNPYRSDWVDPVPPLIRPMPTPNRPVRVWGSRL
jgi:hypothetical protein